MIEPTDSPPPPPRKFWLVRMLSPRPAETFWQQFREVIRRTAWLLPCEVALLLLLALVGLSAGNVGAEEVSEWQDQGPLRFLAMGAILAPVAEEVIFRGLPSLLSDLVLRRQAGQRWVLGFIMALLFAAVHNLSNHGSEVPATAIALGGSWYLDTSMLPASQFLFGLLLWDLVRRYGLWASAFSHMFHNLVFLSLSLLQPTNT